MILEVKQNQLVALLSSDSFPYDPIYYQSGAVIAIPYSVYRDTCNVLRKNGLSILSGAVQGKIAVIEYQKNMALHQLFAIAKARRLGQEPVWLYAGEAEEIVDGSELGKYISSVSLTGEGDILFSQYLIRAGLRRVKDWSSRELLLLNYLKKLLTY